MSEGGAQVATPQPQRSGAPSQLGLSVEDRIAMLAPRTHGASRELGALVRTVTPASLGAALGIRSGDLLVAIGGTPVASAVEIRRALAELPDAPVRVTIRRGAVRMDLTLEE